MENMLERAKEEEGNRDGELDVVNEILTEEMEICFSGGRSVEETIDVIQSRVQLYLDENK